MPKCKNPSNVTVGPQEQSEAEIQHQVRLTLGKEPDLVLFRNSIGVDRSNGTYIKYGLCPGSADLVGILAPRGRWFCLELKAKHGRVALAQDLWMQLIRMRGGFATVVRSVEEAQAALGRARRGEDI